MNRNCYEIELSRNELGERKHYGLRVKCHIWFDNIEAINAGRAVEKVYNAYLTKEEYKGFRPDGESREGKIKKGLYDVCLKGNIKYFIVARNDIEALFNLNKKLEEDFNVVLNNLELYKVVFSDVEGEIDESVDLESFREYEAFCKKAEEDENYIGELCYEKQFKIF